MEEEVEAENIIEVKIDKELRVDLKKNKQKWAKYYFMLCGGALCWRKKEQDATIRGQVLLAEVEVSEHQFKKRTAIIKISVNENENIYVDFNDVSVRDEWIEVIHHNKNEPPGFGTESTTIKKKKKRE